MLQPSLHHQLENVLFHVLKYKIKQIIIFDNLMQFNYVRMMKLFKYFNLIEADAVLPIGIFLFNFLNSDYLFRFLINGLNDWTKTTVTECLAKFIFLHFIYISLEGSIWLYSLFLNSIITCLIIKFEILFNNLNFNNFYD